MGTKQGASTELFQAARKGSLSELKSLLNPGRDLRIRDEEGHTLLHAAAEGGSLETFNHLIQLGLDPYDVSTIGRTVLHSACRKGQYRMVMFLCERYPKLMTVCNKYKVPTLAYAAIGGHIGTFKYLVQRKLDAYQENDYGWNVLHYAAAEPGRLDMVKYLTKMYPDLTRKITKDQWTSLHAGATSGDVQIFKFLSEQGIDVYGRTDTGLTVLHLACSNGYFELVKYIATTYPGLLNTVDCHRWTPLHESAKHGNVQIFKFLADQGMDVYTVTKNGSTVLQIACLKGQYDLVKHITEKYPKMLKSHDNDKWTPLHASADGGSVDVFRLLASNNLNLHAVAKNGTTILHVACSQDNLDMVKHIVTSYPELKTKVSEDGLTALHYSAKAGNVDIFKYLVVQGLDPFCVTKNGQTVLLKACEGDKLAMAKYIVSAYPGLKNKTDLKQCTALHFAAQYGSIELFSFLVEAGQDVHSMNEGGGNVLHIACYNGKYDIVKHILSNYPELKNSRMNDNATALHLSASGGLDIFKLLVDHGLDVYDEYKPGLNVLSEVTSKASYAMIPYLRKTYPKLDTANKPCGNSYPTTNRKGPEEKTIGQTSNIEKRNRDDSVVMSSGFLESIRAVARMSAFVSAPSNEDNDPEESASEADGEVTVLEDNHCETCNKKSTGQINQAAWFCQDCGDRICNQCKSYHQIFRPISSHKMINLRPSCNLCVDGSEEETGVAGWYCKDCKEFICQMCRDYHKRLRQSKDHVVIDSRDEIKSRTK